MALISATRIQQSRKHRYCASCRKPIYVGQKTIRLFGQPDRDTPPYTMYIHPDCANQEVTKRLQKQSADD